MLQVVLELTVIEDKTTLILMEKQSPNDNF